MGKYSAPVQDHLVLPAVVRLPEGEEYSRRQAGRDIPHPIAVRLVIDTGSRRTTLIPGIVRNLEVPGGPDVRVVTPTVALATTFIGCGLTFPTPVLPPSNASRSLVSPCRPSWRNSTV